MSQLEKVMLAAVANLKAQLDEAKVVREEAEMKAGASHAPLVIKGWVAQAHVYFVIFYFS